MTMAQLWLQLKLPRCHMLRLLLTVCVPPMACIMPCAVLWLALLLNPTAKGAAALSPDGLALLHFKRNLTNGDVVLFNWNETDATLCDWVGVTCASEGFSVLELDVSSTSRTGPRPALEGKLSSSLGSLANLTVLDLSGNKLSGSIPPEIANARSLDYLDLGNNSLSGSIPSGISNLTDLEYLQLDKNSLSGPIPDLSLLTKLRRLLLGGGNNLSASAGKAPDLANLRHLEMLDLSGCNIQGAMPTWLAGMRNLARLNLSFNQLGGPIGDQIWATKSLVLVDLSSNHFNGSIPGQLLQQLQMSEFYDEATHVFNLSSNGLTGRIPDSLTANAGHGVFTVDLSNNRLDGPIPSSFGELRTLRLQNNRLEGEIGSGWFNPSGLLDLRLQDNNLTGELGPSTYAQWQGLEFLDLSRNAGLHLVDGNLTNMLDTLSNLEEVRLNGIGGSGKLLPTKNNTISILKVLDLGRSGLEGDLSDFLQADAGVVPFPDLELLDLSRNRLTGKIPSTLLCMLSLTALNLSFNHLSGQLPVLPPRFFNESFFAGNPELCGQPKKRCSPPLYKVVLKLMAGLVACALVISACSCFFLIWRLRIYSKRHQQDADLIAALKGKDTACLMPLADLRKATSNFADSSQIGVGGFGTVYKGKLHDGTLVAIKKSNRLGSQEDKDQFLNEVQILSQVNHRNLVHLLGCCLANGVALLVFEYVPNGSLEDHLWRRSPAATAPPLTWTQRLQIALHTAEALAYLHSAANPPIFHRDVKSANILLDENMNAKVADFGISKLAPLDATHVSTMAVQGSRGYIDPEYYMTFQLSAKSDVFSFGVVLLELISGRAPVYLERAASEMEATSANLARVAVPLINSNRMQEIIDPALSETFWSATGSESMLAVGALAVRCLEPKSKDRPTMTQVCNELESLWLSLDSTFNFSDQVLQGSHLLGLQDIPENDCISFLSNNSYPGGSMSAQCSSSSSSHDLQLADRATF